MKRIFYQYTCLLYSLIQLYVFYSACILVSDIFASEDQGGLGAVIVGILTVAVIFGTAVLDKLLRGIKNNNFFCRLSASYSGGAI